MQIDPENITLYSLCEKSFTLSQLKQATAVIFYDGKNANSITYAELNTCINVISKQLISLSKPNQIIACHCDVGVILLALILGILKTNSSFIILPKHSDNSLKNAEKFLPITTVIAESKYAQASKLTFGPCWILTQSFLVNSDKLLIYQKTCDTNCIECYSRGISRKMCPNLAYAIETSGTTGCPKIVQVPHQCIAPNILHFIEIYSMCSRDNVFLAAPITFDPCIIDIFITFATGATLVVISDQLKAMPNVLTNVLLQYEVTVLQVTPSLLHFLGESFVKSKLLSKQSRLRILSLGGERCPTFTKLKSLKEDGNKTRIFNLYGLTEVSCWAMYHEINFDVITECSDVELGIPLLDTEITVKDESGQSVNEGFGQLYVGGDKRQCIVNDELWNPKETKRATGDWVCKTESGKIFFKGRQDSIIKYHGKIFYVCSVDKALETIPYVQNHAVVFQHDELKLYLFVSLCSSCTKSKEEMEAFIAKSLRHSLLTLPLCEIFFVPNIPVNTHGKSDFKWLMNYAKEERAKEVKKNKVSEEFVIKFISALWKEYTGVNNIDPDDNFILCGGSSVLALQFILEVEKKFFMLCPLLLDTLLNSTYDSFTQLLLQIIINKCPPTKKRKTEVDSTIAKSTNIVNSTRINLCHYEATRRGLQMLCFCDKCSTALPVNCLNFRDCELKEDFKIDLKKCIDASPCVVKYGNGDFICYIGSHSGLFCAVNMLQHAVLWMEQLSDRIESSSCMSLCGNYVYVGCYDHCLYSFDALNGNLQWKFQTGAEVKSSPVASEHHIFVGSHDHNLYALDKQDGHVIWKQQVGEGSIFSSPAVSSGYVCAATLDGCVACFNMENGNLLWKYKHTKPFFSSPVFVNTSVIVGCVDGNVLKINYSGNLVASYATNGPVFSSVALLPTDKNDVRIVFGSHDYSVYCYSLKNHGHLWTFKCPSPVYATPFPFMDSVGQCYVAVVCTEGKIFLLNAEDGTAVCSVNCPGEIFSSPVIVGQHLVIGSRDDNVYFFRITSLQK